MLTSMSGIEAGRRCALRQPGEIWAGIPFAEATDMGKRANARGWWQLAVVSSAAAAIAGAGCDEEPAWRDVFVPGDIEIYNGTLGAVWAAAPDFIFAVGGNFGLEYNGTDWLEHDAMCVDSSFRAIIGFPSGAIVAVGTNSVVSTFSGGLGATQVPELQTTLNGVWGTATDRLWVVGARDVEPAEGVLFQSDEDPTTVGAFIEVTVPDLPGALHAIWGRSEEEIFAVGDGGTILHFDGISWAPEVSGTGSSLRGIAGDLETVIAVGADPPVVLERIADTWQDVTPPAALGGAPAAVAISPRGDVYVVGDGLRLRRVEGVWLDESLGAPERLVSIWALADNAYAVSDAGALTHFGTRAPSATIVGLR